MLVVLLNERLDPFMPVPKVHNLIPQPSQNNHLVLPPLNQTQQPSHKQHNHKEDQSIQQSFLMLRGQRVPDVHIVTNLHLAILIAVSFNRLVVVHVLAGGCVGR